MYTKLIKTFLSSIVFILIVHTQAMAQVTIGSSEAPAAGSILQIKNRDNNNAINADKGIGLPRVTLTDLNNLYPMFENQAGGDYVLNGATFNKAQEDAKHTGLIVYNISASNDNCSIASGVYVWSGTEWTPIYSEYVIDTKALSQPNCYMLTSGTSGSISIPVNKVFSVWEYYGSPNEERLPDEQIKEDGLKATIHWQDGDIIDGTPVVSGKGRNAIISVHTTGKAGNAVIALYDADNVIRWSWHIWVTPPMTTKSFSSYTWMDRDLGAVSNIPGDDGTIGLLYQSGRKDPFPGYAKFDGSIRTISGEVNALGKYKLTLAETPPENLKYAITNPASIIYCNYYDIFDWYDPNDLTDWYSIGRWTFYLCNEKTKAAFDPCPEGWILPPWKTKDRSKYTASRLEAINEATLIPSKGWEWTDAGFWPFSGEIDYEGDLIGIRASGNFYNESLAGNGYSHITLYPTGTWIGGHSTTIAASVRCVKQE